MDVVPKYDYHCTECGTIFLNIHHKLTDCPWKICIECQMPALKQELSSVRTIKMADSGYRKSNQPEKPQ